MNSSWAYWQGLLPLAERGRPVQRLVRGLLWTALSVVVIWLVLFLLFKIALPPNNLQLAG